MIENQQASKKLQDELRKLFQFDVSDLDFGIYRILNRKKVQIEKFIEKDLLDAVNVGLEAYKQQDASQTEEIKQQILDTIGPDAFKEKGELDKLYRNSPLGKKYLDALKKAEKQQVGADTEKKIYNDLFTFFSRYYSEGDFVTKRRISTRDSKYAVPYNGEEVLLHWANKDQYYIKTGEHFTNYKFEVDGKSVWFKVAQAEQDRDNVKEEEKRSFVLRPDNPIEVNDDELTVWFEYRPLTDEEEVKWRDIYNKIENKKLKGVDRQKLCISYDEWIRSEVDGEWRKLLSVIPQNKDRSILYQKLNHYTGKNTTDYFIHKDLQSFLERELEYYLKNEVIRVDDFIEDQTEQAMDVALTRAKVVRSIGKKIIAFLSQIENFQKKLFEKRKFVVDTHYCFTLDRVPEDLYETILQNEQQLKVWKELYAMNQWDGELKWDGNWTKKFLKDDPFLMVDTKWFDEEFKYQLLSIVEDLDQYLNGLNINGDNIQVLNLLLNKYGGKIDCIHIDPPYNTDTSGFLYKNSYKHSSWLSMMNDRISISIKLLSSMGSFQCHIDENEYERLHSLLNKFDLNNAGTVIWDKRNPMNGGAGIAPQHEYLIWRTNHNDTLYVRNDAVKEMLKKAKELIAKEGEVNETVRKKFSSWVNNNEELTGGEKAYRYIDDKGNIYQSVSLRAPDPRTDEKFFQRLIHPVTNKPCAIPPNGFSRTPDTLANMIENDEILFGKDETTQPRQKVILKDTSQRQFNSLLQDGRKGKYDLKKLGLDFPYCHPVSLYEEFIFSASGFDSYVFDYFAGSGTTIESVINLNNEDGGNRRYLTVEMGSHFETVLKPRSQKIVFSKNWKDGVPQDKKGQSHAYKYHFIESYEDALNNIDFKNPEDTQTAMEFEDYMLSYMLDFETQGVNASLLKDGAFDTPFDYKLNIQRGHESPKQESVDLVETFHYLIGLWVQKLRRLEHQNRKYIISIGQIRNEDAVEDVCIIWRNTKDLNLDEEAEWIQKEIINGQTFDRIYINGVSKVKDAEPIEITFREKMFEDVA